MYWVIERLTKDHTWQAVLSNVSAMRHSPDPQVFVAMALGAPNPAFFAVMSGLETANRTRFDPDIQPFASNGLPQNISDYTKGLLVHPLSTGGPLRKAPFSDRGHFRLDTLVEAANTGGDNITHEDILFPNAPAADFLRLLQVRLEVLLGLGPDSQTGIADREILIGRVTETYDGKIRHDDLDALSMHTRLRLLHLYERLTPPSIETCRLLFAYSS
jgi:hypothetical protein